MQREQDRLSKRLAQTPAKQANLRHDEHSLDSAFLVTTSIQSTYGGTDVNDLYWYVEH